MFIWDETVITWGIWMSTLQPINSDHSCFIGCNLTSVFYAKGNCTAYSLLKYPECMERLEQLEKYFKLPAITAAQVEQFVCWLYGVEAGNSNIDDVRYLVFWSQSTITQYSLSPTKDELNLKLPDSQLEKVDNTLCWCTTSRTWRVDCWKWQHKYNLLLKCLPAPHLNIYWRVYTALVRSAATHQDVDVRSLKCSALLNLSM